MNEDVKPENVRIHSRADELIACLEGEIAKRDARILELESQYHRDVYGLNNEGDPIGGDPAGGYANDNARLRKALCRASLLRRVCTMKGIFVSVELLERVLDYDGAVAIRQNARHELRALLSAPSPAGVDGLEVVATLLIDDPTDQECGDWDIEVESKVAERMSEHGGGQHELCRLSDATAIIDGLRGEVAAQRIKTCTALKERNDAREERDAAATECERLRMQLAACGVVALSNTIESAGKARQMHPDYMSASCSDVAGAVDREIALRTERDQQAQRIGELEGLLREVRDTYRAAIHWEDLRGTMKRIDAALSAGKEGE